MATKPTSPVSDWATATTYTEGPDAGNPTKVPVPGGTVTNGHIPGAANPPIAQHVNTHINNVAAWQKYFEEVTDENEAALAQLRSDFDSYASANDARVQNIENFNSLLGKGLVSQFDNSKGVATGEEMPLHNIAGQLGFTVENGAEGEPSRVKVPFEGLYLVQVAVRKDLVATDNLSFLHLHAAGEVIAFHTITTNQNEVDFAAFTAAAVIKITDTVNDRIYVTNESAENFGISGDFDNTFRVSRVG